MLIKYYFQLTEKYVSLFCFSTDVNLLFSRLFKNDPLVNFKVKDQIISSLRKLQSKLFARSLSKFIWHKALRKHEMPLTNVTFNSTGTK